MIADPQLQARFRATADPAVPPIDDALARVLGRADRRRRARRVEAVVAVVAVVGLLAIGARIVTAPERSRPGEDLPTPSVSATEMSTARKVAAMARMEVVGPRPGTETVLTPADIAGFVLDRIAADEALIGGVVVDPRIETVMFVAPEEPIPSMFVGEDRFAGEARWVVWFRGTVVDCFYWCDVLGDGAYLFRDAPLGSEPGPAAGSRSYAGAKKICVAAVPGYTPPEQVANETPCLVRALGETPGADDTAVIRAAAVEGMEVVPPPPGVVAELTPDEIVDAVLAQIEHDENLVGRPVAVPRIASIRYVRLGALTGLAGFGRARHPSWVVDYTGTTMVCGSWCSAHEGAVLVVRDSAADGVDAYQQQNGRLVCIAELGEPPPDVEAKYPPC